MQIFDAAKLDKRQNHALQLSVIVPRPIGWVSTVSADGIPNLAPFSFYNGVSSNPPILMVSVGLHHGTEKKDTTRNIQETGEVAVNVVPESMMNEMLITSNRAEPEVSEFDLAKLETAPCVKIRPPRVALSPVCMECVLEQHHVVHSTDLFLGRILLYHVQEDLLTDGAVDPEKLKPLGRLGGKLYTTLGTVLTSEKS